MSSREAFINPAETIPQEKKNVPELQLQVLPQLVLLGLLHILDQLPTELHGVQLVTVHLEPELVDLTATPAWYRPGALELSVLSQAFPEVHHGITSLVEDKLD